MSRDYNDLFQEHLEMKLRAGGPPKLMVSVVRIYESDDSVAREYAFRDWVASEEFDCNRCRVRFRATADLADGYDQVLCQSCAKDCR